MPSLDNQTPVAVLDDTLDGITARYGERTASMVAMQLEYPRPAQRGVSTDARRSLEAAERLAALGRESSR